MLTGRMKAPRRRRLVLVMMDVSRCLRRYFQDNLDDGERRGVKQLNSGHDRSIPEYDPTSFGSAIEGATIRRFGTAAAPLSGRVSECNDPPWICTRDLAIDRPKPAL